MKKLILSLTVLVLAQLFGLLIAGCGGSGAGSGGGGDSTGMGQVVVTVGLPSGLKGRSISEIVSFKLTVTAADLAASSTTFTPNADKTATTSLWLKAGKDRSLFLEALDSAGKTIYEAKALSDVIENSKVSLTMTLAPSQGDIDLKVIVHTGPPKVKIDYLPPYGSGDNLKGHIEGGMSPDLLGLAVYINVNGLWWIKPYANRPMTLPTSDGLWVCDITTGGIDERATEIAVYLVKRTESIPAYGGVAVLPAIPGALDLIDIQRPKP